MPATRNVTLLNEGGKYVAVDMKHIPAGGQRCRMDKDATLVRVGPGATPGTPRPLCGCYKLSSGGCPFMTTFDLPDSRLCQRACGILSR